MFAGLLLGNDCRSARDCAQGECAEEELSACLELCVQPGVLGDACSDDPCSLAPGETVCDYGFVCDGGSCVAEPASLLIGCEPADEHQACGGTTFCAGRACNRFIGNSLSWIDASANGVCMLPAVEGAVCDGDWTNLNGTSCAPCEPGLQCLPAPWDGDLTVCQRDCGVSEDCSCDVVEFTNDDACENRFCKVCIATGEECGHGPECCDKDNVGCEATTVIVDGEEIEVPPRCCGVDGSTCGEDQECCGHFTCDFGQCARCGWIPGGPPAAAGCCSPLELRYDESGSPYCGKPCPLTDRGETCRTEGPCGAVDQPFTCDAIKGDVCVPIDSDIEHLDECIDMEKTAECAGSIRGRYICNGDDELECQSTALTVCPGVGCQNGTQGWCDCPDYGNTQLQCGTNSDCQPGEHCWKVMGSVGGTSGIVKSRCIPCSGDRVTCWAPGMPGGCLPGTEPSPPPNNGDCSGYPAC